MLRMEFSYCCYEPVLFRRARLEVQMNPTNEMLQTLNDNVDWLREINDEITSKFQLVGDAALLAALLEQSQVSL